MKIGLYSELARENIVKGRAYIAKMGLSPNREGIQKFRKQIINLNDPHLKSLQQFNDFYSVSTLRDALFHVQEHRFTIPKISKALDELGLKFIGFEFSNRTSTQNFKIAYPENGSAYDLEKWHDFETKNPLLFIDMYQFWVQKS